MKRRLFALLVGVMTAITAGCAPATGAACLRRLYAWELSTLNYLITSRSHELSFAANCIGTLVEYDAYGILGPGLAESWTESDDGLMWTFTLREGLTWVDSEGRNVCLLYTSSIKPSWTRRAMTPRTLRTCPWWKWLRSGRRKEDWRCSW